ncbi:MAG TPA: hypothetical protein DCM38_12770 [Gammaproteobacteria bacterium]|nr:hypothetical protein [Gammaproteobacteria bacterium]
MIEVAMMPKNWVALPGKFKLPSCPPALKKQKYITQKTHARDIFKASLASFASKRVYFSVFRFIHSN